jgi:hypothetical protein
VAARGSNDDGSIADLPWASVFDPASNVRALSAIQARGFRAATEVVDRLVKLTDSDPAPDGDDPADATKSGAGPDVDRVLSTWQNLVGQLVSSIRGQASPQTGAATFDLANSEARGQVRFESNAPGLVSAEIWLHNGGPGDLGEIRLRCSDLLAHDGGVVASGAVRFEPATVPLVARSSRGVTMALDVTEDVAPGCYRGTLLADGHADVWLPVVLTVVAPPS